MSFAVGSLVRARGREWVVLPESEPDMLVLRPLGGTDDEIAGVYLPLEKVEPAQFDLPDPTHVGDHRSCRLLRDAVRLSSRACAGPFRSFARIAVEPRPYQLVPLLMALRLNPVRMLISDDVGIGKTVEAGLVARELLDRGEIGRIAVLSPPHLAEQWQDELNQKFHIDAELVLPSTAASLERNCRAGESVFDVYPHVVVSMDYIKSDRRREDFARACPEMVIVDEAHTCAYGYEGRGGKHQRHQLLAKLAADAKRHLILITACPHSGNEAAFRSLLGLLNPDFAGLPQDLTGPENESHRRRLAAHFIQRRRGDIRQYLGAKTHFPSREGEDREATYKLTPEYHKFFERVLRYTRDAVIVEEGGQFRKRVRWWSALALLRSVTSSPAAAVDTLRNRTPTAEAETPDEADEIGRRAVLDLVGQDHTEGTDVVPGGDAGEPASESDKNRRLLLDMAREAEQLKGDKDAKLIKAVTLIKDCLKDGFRPIVFCRFIPTAEYVASELRARLPKDVEVAAITGLLPPADRQARVLALAKAPKHVLVCTECLSEGINLQEHFDAVFHYDLSWNPTRHEQREGRVDRFGQPREKVRIVTYYGADNPIDGIVLDVLIKKHKRIKNSLGISVPLPVNTDQVVEAIFEGLLLRQKGGTPSSALIPGFEEYFKPRRENLYNEWDAVADREKRSRTMFAQESIKVEEVARELDEVRDAVGSNEEVERFTLESLKRCAGVVAVEPHGYAFDLKECPRALRDALGNEDRFVGKFDLPVDEDVLYLSRTHPVVEGLASHVMDTALDPLLEGIARRAGAIRTKAVAKRTTLLLVRLRYDIITKSGTDQKAQLAEECRLMAFTGAPDAAEWLDENAAKALLDAMPDANTAPEQTRDFVSRVVQGFPSLLPRIEDEGRRRAKVLLESHQRVRAAARITHVAHQIEPKLPPDVLGIYVYLPVAGGQKS